MIITNRRRIRNLERYLSIIPFGSRVIIGISNLDRFNTVLDQIGFTANSNPGESHLPPTNFGTVSDYNANGSYIIRRDLPKETCYRTTTWKWKQWNGRYDTTEMSKLVDVPYDRFPREFVPPPSIELTLNVNTANERLLTTSPIEYSQIHFENIIHRVNLFLEIFRECEIFTENLDRIIQAPIRRLNWTVLPQGRMPWNRLQNSLNEIINRAPDGNQEFIRNRLQTINKYNPTFVAIGSGGFIGYIIFGFDNINLYILESIFHGNATYVFQNDWETLSQMTKADILSQNLQRDRIIHRCNWFDNISNLLNSSNKFNRIST